MPLHSNAATHRETTQQMFSIRIVVLAMLVGLAITPALAQSHFFDQIFGQQQQQKPKQEHKGRGPTGVRGWDVLQEGMSRSDLKTIQTY